MGLFPPNIEDKNNKFSLPGGFDPVPVKVFQTTHDVLLKAYKNCPK